MTLSYASGTRSCHSCRISARSYGQLLVPDDFQSRIADLEENVPLNSRCGCLRNGTADNVLARPREPPSIRLGSIVSDSVACSIGREAIEGITLGGVAHDKNPSVEDRRRERQGQQT